MVPRHREKEKVAALRGEQALAQAGQSSGLHILVACAPGDFCPWVTSREDAGKLRSTSLKRK